MDLDTLKTYESYGRRLTENDRKRLQGMREREEFKELIGYMLEHDVKLEQECIRLNGEIKPAEIHEVSEN